VFRNPVVFHHLHLLPPIQLYLPQYDHPDPTRFSKRRQQALLTRHLKRDRYRNP
jgi:hypothetical protein